VALADVALANQSSLCLLVKGITSRSILQQAYTIFRCVDTSCKGYLGWYSGEIRTFVARVFQHFGISQPSQGQVFLAYHVFEGSDATLSARGCLCLVDLLCRAIVFGLRQSDTEGIEADVGDVEPVGVRSALVSAAAALRQSVDPKVNTPPKLKSSSSASRIPPPRLNSRVCKSGLRAAVRSR